MEATKERPTPGQRVGRKKLRYFNRPSEITTPYREFSKENFHPSRHPERRREDAEILAAVGLAFERVPGTSFHRLCRKGV